MQIILFILFYFLINIFTQIVVSCDTFWLRNPWVHLPGKSSMATGPSIDCTYEDNVKLGKPTSLNSPHDVICHRGRYIVTDTQGHRVVSINPLDNSSKDLCKGKPEPQTTQHNIEPYAIIALSDSDCDFLFTDQKNRCVLHINDEGCRKWNRVVSLEDHFEHPTGIAINSSGEVFVADCKKHCIYVFDNSGSFIRSFGADDLKFPWFMAFNSKGQLHVSDNDGKVKIFGKSDDGLAKHRYKLLKTIDVEMDKEKWKCRGIDIDQFDNIFVTVRSAKSKIGFLTNEKVTIYDHIHDAVANFGGRSQFSFIRGVCLDYGRNFIVVVDGEGDRLQRFKLYNDPVPERLPQATSGASFLGDYDMSNAGDIDFGAAQAILQVDDLTEESDYGYQYRAESFDNDDGFEFDDSIAQDKAWLSTHNTHNTGWQ